MTQQQNKQPNIVAEQTNPNENTEDLEDRPSSAPPALCVDKEQTTLPLESKEYIDLIAHKRKANPRIPPPKTNRSSRNPSTQGQQTSKATRFDISGNLEDVSYDNGDDHNQTKESNKQSSIQPINKEKNIIDVKSKITSNSPSSGSSSFSSLNEYFTINNNNNNNNNSNNNNNNSNYIANNNNNTGYYDLSLSSIQQIPTLARNNSSSSTLSGLFNFNSQPNGTTPRITTPNFQAFNSIVQQTNQLAQGVNNSGNLTPIPITPLPIQGSGISSFVYNNNNDLNKFSSLKTVNNNNTNKETKSWSHDIMSGIGPTGLNTINNDNNNLIDNKKENKQELLNPKIQSSQQPQLQQQINNNTYATLDSLNSNFASWIPQMPSLQPQLSIGSLSNFPVTSDPIGQDGLFLSSIQDPRHQQQAMHRTTSEESTASQGNAFFVPTATYNPATVNLPAKINEGKETEEDLAEKMQQLNVNYMYPPENAMQYGMDQQIRRDDNNLGYYDMTDSQMPNMGTIVGPGYQQMDMYNWQNVQPQNQYAPQFDQLNVIDGMPQNTSNPYVSFAPNVPNTTLMNPNANADPYNVIQPTSLEGNYLPPQQTTNLPRQHKRQIDGVHDPNMGMNRSGTKQKHSHRDNNVRQQYQQQRLQTQDDNDTMQHVSHQQYALIGDIDPRNLTRSNITLSDLIQREIIEKLALDQYGSRFIQQQLESATPEEKEGVFKQIKRNVLSLCEDVFGNYVIQKFFEHGSDHQKKELANIIMGHVLPLAKSMYGCRVIQKAFECVSEPLKVKLVEELKGHVEECVQNQNGNHVIQKCIEDIPAKYLDFIVNTFKGKIFHFSTHPYGCRVIQRLLECCTETQKQPLLEEIEQHILQLSKDQYGNYVVQHVISHGPDQARSNILRIVAEHILQMSKHKFSSNVVEKCFLHSTDEEKDLLLDDMIGKKPENSPLIQMVRDPFGNYVIQKVLEVTNVSQRNRLIKNIMELVPNLRKLMFGKHIIAKIEKITGKNVA